MTTNRPTYAPQRRPGETTDPFNPAELIAFHLAADDVLTIAALVEAGAAAIKYGPATTTAGLETITRDRHVQLGKDVARSLRAELRRVRAPRRR